MKPILLLTLCLMLCGTGEIWAQNSPKTVQDTSSAHKRKYQPKEVREPLLPEPGKPDSFGYNNKIYNEGIKHAEYQNRGAEDRRDPLSVDPNATPDRRVPAQKTMHVDTMK